MKNKLSLVVPQIRDGFGAVNLWIVSKWPRVSSALNFNKHRHAYIIGIIGMAGAFFGQSHIANNKAEKQKDTQDKKIERLSAENSQLKQTQQEQTQADTDKLEQLREQNNAERMMVAQETEHKFHRLWSEGQIVKQENVALKQEKAKLTRVSCSLFIFMLGFVSLDAQQEKGVISKRENVILKVIGGAILLGFAFFGRQEVSEKSVVGRCFNFFKAEQNTENPRYDIIPKETSEQDVIEERDDAAICN